MVSFFGEMEEIEVEEVERKRGKKTKLDGAR